MSNQGGFGNLNNVNGRPEYYAPLVNSLPANHGHNIPGWIHNPPNTTSGSNHKSPNTNSQIGNNLLINKNYKYNSNTINITNVILIKK